MQDLPPTSDDEGDIELQGASARPGGFAKGGVDPQPHDAVSPAQADPASRDAAREMRARGFGDDKGGDIS